MTHTPEAAPMREDLVPANEPDLSWIDICITGSPGNEIIVNHSVGWSDFDLEPPYLCDNVEDYEAPKEPGLYRWSGYVLGYWGDGDPINIKGGTWTPYRLASARPEADQPGYATPFFEIATMLGIGAQAKSPKEVWETQMRPKLEALIGRPDAGDNKREHVMPGDPYDIQNIALQWYLNFDFGYPHSVRESNIAVEGFKDGYRAALSRPGAGDEVERGGYCALLPQVIALVVAARNAVADPVAEALGELDRAVEQFAASVPWDDEPKETLTIDPIWAHYQRANCLCAAAQQHMDYCPKHGCLASGAGDEVERVALVAKLVEISGHPAAYAAHIRDEDRFSLGQFRAALAALRTPTAIPQVQS